MRLMLALLALFACAWPAAARAQEKPRIAVVSIHIAETPAIARAGAARVVAAVSVDFFGLGGGMLPGIEDVDLGAYDLVLIDAAGPRLLNHLDRIEAAKRRTQVVVVGGGTPISGTVDLTAHADIQRYWDNATEENYAGLFGYLAARLLDQPIPVVPPVVYPPLALWHPDATKPFATLADFRGWIDGRLADAGQRPRVAILFYRSLALADNMAVVEALVREVERQGGLPLPIWRQGGDALASTLLGGEPIDALILCGNRLDYADAARGVAEATRLGVPPLLCAIDTSHSPDEWRAAIGGFAPGQTGTLALGEMEGIVEPMIVGARSATANGEVRYDPLPEQVRWRVARAMAWARLHRRPNADKRIAITYHSEDASEADVGSDPDSYLDAQASIVAVLHRLQKEGYDVGVARLPDAATLGRRLAAEGSNLPAGATAALAERIRQGAISIDAETYRRWYAELPRAVRDATEARWGPPPGRQMTLPDGRIVIPALRFGKIILAAHPTWGMDDPGALAGSGALPPHHQYLAFYLWMQHEGEIDAYLPLFTQLSLMPGKQQGPSADDPVGVLIGHLPHISPLPLQANGGVGNKRRTQAVTIGFMPEFVRAGLSPDLAEIATRLDAPARDETAVRALAGKAGLGAALGLDIRASEWAALEPALRRYLDEAAGAPMPRGGHILGQAPDAPTTVRLVQAMLAANGDAPPLAAVQQALAGDASALPDTVATRAADYARRLAAAPREMDAVIAALAGRYVEPGPMGDAIRNPDTLPAGRNAYTLDIRAMPSRAAWEAGERLGDDLVVQHRQRTGHAPRKVAFVLWSGEAVQNGGTSEAQILRLLGARPVWNARGQVVDVTLDDRTTLGRPRVDVLVTTSGTYRDHFQTQLALIAKAIRLASDAGEEDNPVREETLARAADLRRAGLAPDAANARALRRIFSTAPGAYSPSTQFAVREGWDANRLNRLFEARIGHAYGDGAAGEVDAAAFTANLSRVDAAVFARSSSAYGMLDTPLPAAYFGGLSAAVKARTGRSIETYVANGQQPDKARIETLARFYARERDSRYLNPEWIRAMQASGYNGARYMADLGDAMLLWDVNTPDLIDDRDWAAVRDVYVRDRYKLGLTAYFKRHNPAAREKLIRTMLDAIRRGTWDAGEETRAELEQALAGTRDAAMPGQRRIPAAQHAGRNRERRTAGAPGATALPAPMPGAISGFELRTVSPPPPLLPRAVPAWQLWVLLAAMLGLLMLGSARRPQW